MKHPADLMLHDATDGLRASPEATARAIGYALHRRHGNDASRLADLVVGAVQEAQRAPTMPVVDAEYIEPPYRALPPTSTMRWIWFGGVVIFVTALFVGTVIFPEPTPIKTGPGYEICTTEGC